MKKTINKNYFKVGLQIFLLIAATFAFAYILKEGSSEDVIINYNENSDNELINALAAIGSLIFSEEGLVSAQEAIYTCPKSKEGKSCQEYPSSICSSECAVACIPSRRENVGECKPGTCYDSKEGICEVNAPKASCDILGGKWFNDPKGNIKECKRGCCLIGDQAIFATEQQCARSSALLGITKKFRPELKSELACIGLAKTQEEGACIFEKENENTCKFTKKSDCLQIGGKFLTGTLCSNPDLKTNCKPQVKAECVQGKDEVYWFDSCGNRENIYDADKIKSYNKGNVLAKAASCSVESGSSFLGNQKSCGNCNYLRGSKCGKKTETQKVADNNIDAVCRDLTCVDRNKNKRINGESWCVYQSSTGTDGKRSTDVAGSRHFREACVDGEVKIEPCADYRNEICVESKTALENGHQFSSAACRLNKWQECTSFNSFEQEEGGEEEREVDPRCGANPDCFIRHVEIGGKMNFDMCLPKYAPGFDLGTGGKGASGLCSTANKKCRVTYVKPKYFGSWSCKENCECMKDKFAEEMHDVCMSLGDCGAKVNYMGVLTKNFKIKVSENPPIGKKPEITDGYLSGISGYAKPTKGKIIPPGEEYLKTLGSPTGSDLLSISGVGGLIAAVQGSFPGQTQSAPTTVITGGTSGITGSAVQDNSNSITGNAVITGMQGAGERQTEGTAGQQGGEGVPVVKGTEESTQPAQSGNSNYAAAGSALGAVSNLLGGTGGKEGASQDEGLATASMIVGAVGALASAAALLPAFAAAAGVLGPIGLGLAVVALILLLLSKQETKVITVDFKCYAWQPPSGGADCKKCGSDKLPCSKYSCASLGQSCKLINEGNPQVECIDSAPDDAGSPVISPLYSTITQGYNYTNVSANGFKITSKQDCLRAYTPVEFGITTNEPAQCKFDVNHTARFEDMADDFGNNLYLRNQTATINIPSLESLGISGFDPNRRADYNLYIRCQDANGNKNVKEYNINFCVEPGDDITAPAITSRVPEFEFVKFGATNLNASVYAAEPVECRWDENDVDYDIMKNNFVCNTGYEQTDFNGWKCDTTLPVVKNESILNVRCKDQPWFAITNESSRNKNTESYKFKIKKSPSKLRIDSIAPDNNTIIYSGVKPMTVEVVAKTAGGVDGTATCYYIFENNTILFYDTIEKSTHRNIFNQFFPGDFSLPIKCSDKAGNEAQKTTKFRLRIDTTAPEVTRVYEQAGSLVVITNENSECSYIASAERTAEGCDFDSENSSLMSGTEREHSSSFNQGLTHYIKCYDPYGNKLGTCSVIVRGGYT